MNRIQVVAALCLSIGAAEYTVDVLKEEAPKELADAVRKEMAPTGARVLEKDGGKPHADLWLRAAMPLEDAAESLMVKYPALKPGRLVGAIRFHARGGDYKNQSIPPGVYTLRYGVQPEDGDHQGVSDTKDYLMLVPAAGDASPADLSQEDLVKASAKVFGKKHPAVLYLVRAGKEGEKVPKIGREEGERWVFEGEIPAAAKDKKPLRLGIVVVGKSPDF